MSVKPRSVVVDGLSPRLRGNRFDVPVLGNRLGSIPAPAGEPACHKLFDCESAVYPRACGGTCGIALSSFVREGLSPRLRGNRGIAGEVGHPGGSIPAPAGEPPADAAYRKERAVYPRACGGTVQTHRVSVAQYGLSPRLRGNQWLTVKRKIKWRSIPAPAGEPPFSSGQCASTKVYPRACGGTDDLAAIDIAAKGLSPRLRGNPNELKHEIV